MFTKAWLENALHTVLLAFLATFVGALAAAGQQLTLSTLHAALIAGYAAAVVALQALLAAPVSPASSSTALLPQALVQRAVAVVRSGAPPTRRRPAGPHA
jgi:hypothetical protein